jgi:hypothetical protein
MALLKSTYTLDKTHDFLSQVESHEISGNANYSAGGKDMTGEGVTIDDANNEIELDANDLTWTNLGTGDTPYGCVIYKEVGASSSDRLHCWLEFTSQPVPNGSDYTVQLATEGAIKATNI